MEQSRRELRKSLDEKELENRVLQSTLSKTQHDLGFYSEQVTNETFSASDSNKGSKIYGFSRCSPDTIQIR
jgi:hypothetical protein